MGDGNALATAPDFKLHRDAVTAADVVTSIPLEAGVNARDYADILANLVVGAGAGNVTFEVLFWSPTAGKFISASTPITHTVAAGGAVAFQFSAEGRTFFIAVTANAAGLAASAEVAAFWIDPRFD